MSTASIARWKPPSRLRCCGCRATTRGCGLTAALYGEITLKAGRVEQGNFDRYEMPRMNQAPLAETHIVASPLPPTGVGEPATPAKCAGGVQCLVRPDQKADSRAADQADVSANARRQRP